MANAISTSIYDGMDETARVVAQEAAAQITALQRSVVADIAEIGSALIRVKEAVGHGSFLPWLKDEFGWTERTAQNYMSVAERLGEKYERVSHLPLKTIYALASPSTPDEKRNEIVAKLEKGEAVEPDEIASELREVRREAVREREEAKKIARRNPKLSADQVKAKLRRTREEKQAQWQKELAERERCDALKQEAVEQFIGCLTSDQRAMLATLLSGQWNGSAPGAPEFRVYHRDFALALERVEAGK